METAHAGKSDNLGTERGSNRDRRRLGRHPRATSVGAVPA